MSTGDRTLKQTYLREAILEADYNADKFVKYLASAKEDGDNIDNWTLDELKFEVQNYKRYYSNEESSIIIQEQSKGVNGGRINREFDGEIAEEKQPEEILISDKYLEETKRNTLNIRRKYTAGKKQMSAAEDWSSKNDASPKPFTRQMSYKTPSKTSTENNKNVYIILSVV